ncbi:MAG: DNA methyltransferase [Candidatus Bathyarchaeia archaeon]
MSKNRLLIINNKVSQEDLLEPFKGNISPNIDPLEAKMYDVIAVYDAPSYLPFWYKYLKRIGFKFKYHIAVYFDPLNEFGKYNLLSSHIGILLVSNNSFDPNKVRVPHKYCKFCGNTLKDWGGKTHLMHPEGSLISDVWKDFNLTYKDIVNQRCPELAIERLKKMFERAEIIEGKRSIFREKENDEADEKINEIPELFKNKVIEGDATEVLKQFPNNCFDTVFIDPPYNLGKQYLSYEDERKDYVSWSLKWLKECFRVMEPNGSLFLLNIPKWAHEILIELLPNYYLIRWIVWDEPAEPRGKLIPAHYALLWLSKSKNVKTYPLKNDQDSAEFCLRINCVKVRRSIGIKDKISVRDVRWDIHRIKHRHKRFKFHPVQLPEKLLKFIIELTTNKGDAVLDPMVGTGTTVAVAKKLGRIFSGIDIDPTYVEITRKRLEGKLDGILEEPGNNFRDKKFRLTKKWIQIEMEKLARKIGRLPTVEDASSYLGVEKTFLLTIFPNWSKALKLAKIKLEIEKKSERLDKYIS